MMLPLLLRQLCPALPPDSAPGSVNLDDCDVFLFTRDTKTIPCHSALLRARCPGLELGSSGRASIDEDACVVLGLLRWTYTESLNFQDLQTQAEHHDENLGHRVSRLADSWGLRDSNALRKRLVRSWRTEKNRGSLCEDLLRAYAQGEQLGSLWFHAEDGTVIYGGWPALLMAGSKYFRAMLGGSWAESHGQCSQQNPVKICWPGNQLQKLVNFLHGGLLLSTAAELKQVAEIADFFGVDAALAQANDWIASNLTHSNVANLWSFATAEPSMRNFWQTASVQDEEALLWRDWAADADDACFDFHVRHFALLAENPEGGDGSWVPLHDLPIPLMYRLLASGLISMNTQQMIEIVQSFASSKSSCHAKRKALSKNLLPPKVLFNRELRDMLLGGQEISIRTVL